MGRRLLPLLLAAAPLAVPAVALSGAECLELGFTDTLSCTQCAKMAEVVKDAELQRECEQCCHDNAEADVTYATAVLEVRGLWVGCGGKGAACCERLAHPRSSRRSAAESCRTCRKSRTLWTR